MLLSAIGHGGAAHAGCIPVANRGQNPDPRGAEAPPRSAMVADRGAGDTGTPAYQLLVVADRSHGPRPRQTKTSSADMAPGTNHWRGQAPAPSAHTEGRCLAPYNPYNPKKQTSLRRGHFHQCGLSPGRPDRSDTSV